MRERAIRAHGLIGTDRPYTLYYDETNNIRRLHVTETGFNVQEPGCFVLGGVGHTGPPRALDVDSLKSAVRLQASAPELKLEHLAKGGLLQVLGSRKLATYLDWVADQGLFVHYLAVDPLYWSSVDIIDSVLANEQVGHLAAFHLELKNDLYTVLRSDHAAVAELYFRYGYPGLAPERRADFLDELRDWVDARGDLLDHFPHQLLKDVLKAGRRAASLPFIEGHAAGSLIDDFATFFIERFTVFKHVQHILDVETVIRRKLTETTLMDGDTPLANHRFVDSKLEPGVQVSDPMVGLLGKFLTYIGQTAPADIVADHEALTPLQRQNLITLNRLLDRSHAETPAFMNNVLALSDRRAAAWILETA